MGRIAVPGLIAGVGLGLALLSPAAAQICPPAPGAAVPREAAEMLARWQARKGGSAESVRPFALRRAWIAKTEAVARRRAELQRQDALLARPLDLETAVGGVISVPVFTVLYANSVGPPYATADLQDHLFSQGGEARSLADVYAEMSQGLLTVQGTVYGWTTLPEVDTHYEGSSQGLNPVDARVGELIRDTLDAWDATVDFGQFDNDGPDGVPNSGDDDGYVDFVSFVHDGDGGECGGNDNIWSHRWVYSAWSASNGMPYQTDDAAAGGGTILVDDYTIQPALACSSTGIIEIGIFCHEVGHIFGLPDLYDLDGGSSGLGDWSLMASGNWNVPASPAHMGAWAKQQLGWVTTVEVGWQNTPLTVLPVATDPVVYELRCTDERWRRREDCALAGGASLAVGLLDQESAARAWNAAKGYGNGWRETVAHDFHSDGSGGVLLSYDYAVQTEGGFDFAFTILEVEGSENLLAVLDGTSSGHAAIDLTPWLPAGPADYRVKFRFTSDTSYSNEDGGFAAGCSPFVVDDVSVTGAGESYFADFESHRGGWYPPDDEHDNPVSERWLVENRQRLGCDQYLHGMGLVVYHVDEEILHTLFGNSGGSTNLSARGLVIDEADGRFDLLVDPTNRGDGGDVWPGKTASVCFDSTTVPSSDANSGYPTRIAIDSIDLAGGVVTCRARAGDPPPRLTGVDPAASPQDAGLITVDLLGVENARHGAAVRLVRASEPDVVADRVDWEDADRVRADFTLAGQAAGAYNVVLENPDGQTTVLYAAFEVEPGATGGDPPGVRPDTFALAQNYPNPFNPATTIRYDVPRAGRVVLRVLDLRGRLVKTLVDAPKPPGYHEATWDGTDGTGRRVGSGLYVYRLESQGFVAQHKMLLLQ